MIKASDFKIKGKIEYGNFDLIGYMIKEIVEDDTYGLRNLQNKYNSKIKTIVDIGGSLGVFSIFSRELFPHARIISLEALDDTFNLLKENVKKYNVEAYNIALGDGSILYLNKCPDHSGANSFKKLGNGFYIKSEKLIDIFKKFNIEKPYVIKIDIEGGEMFLYDDESCVDILRNCHYFAMEYHNINMLGYHVHKKRWDDWLKSIFVEFDIDGLGGNAVGAIYKIMSKT